MNFQRLVESRYPGLIARIREVIEESESRYEGAGGKSESFVWEHSIHTASIASRLAQAEGIDPLMPVIAALFHDSGKFAGGRYHQDDTPEEEQSAHLAEILLKDFGIDATGVRMVVSGLRGLYNEKAKKNRIAAILHDADFLSKFGAMGVAEFFTKSTLRRRTLRSAVLGYLSKELTYASCLPLNMRTQAGRKLASRKSADSIKFFRSLLSELREAGIADLKIRRLSVPHPKQKGAFLKIQIVASSACPKCGAEWESAWTTEDGVKCRKLNVEWICPECGERLETSFCLPEISA